MNRLRHNNRWLVLTLVLAMVCTIGGAPALAIACAAQGAAAGAVQAAPEPAGDSCRTMGTPGHCCCGPAAEASQRAHSEAVGASSHADCDCSVQAPSPAPVDSRLAAPVVHLGMALLPPTRVALQLAPRAPLVFTAAASGPPRSPVRSSSPSRAPPACL